MLYYFLLKDLRMKHENICSIWRIRLRFYINFVIPTIILALDKNTRNIIQTSQNFFALITHIDHIKYREY